MSDIPAAFPKSSLRAQALLEAKWIAGPPGLIASSESAPHELRWAFLFAMPEGGYKVLSVTTPMDAAERPNGPNAAEVASFRTLHRALGEMARSGDPGGPSWERKTRLERVSGSSEILDFLESDASKMIPHPCSVQFRASYAFDRLRDAAMVLDALETAAGEPEIAVRGTALRPEVVVTEGPLASVGRPALAIMIAGEEPSVYLRASGLPALPAAREEAVFGPRKTAVWQVMDVAGRVRDAAGRTKGAGLSGWSALRPAEHADPATEASLAILRITAMERESVEQQRFRARAVRLALQKTPLSSKAHLAASKFFLEQAHGYYGHPLVRGNPFHPERAGWETLAHRHAVLAERLQARERDLQDTLLAYR